MQKVRFGSDEFEVWPDHCLRHPQNCSQCFIVGKILCAPRFRPKDPDPESELETQSPKKSLPPVPEDTLPHIVEQPSSKPQPKYKRSEKGHKRGHYTRVSSKRSDIIKLDRNGCSIRQISIQTRIGKDTIKKILKEEVPMATLKEQLNEVLSTLSPREKRVLQLRFGLEDGRSRTLKEVGKEFNVTGARISQIEAKALRKLRHPSRSRDLKVYLAIGPESPERSLLRAIFGS